MAATLLSGAAFGAALTASGVSHPFTIVSQFHLRNWHMLEVFLAAVASSTFVVSVLRRIGHVKMSPRGYNTLGLFFCDGNAIGGALLGTGMALAGACPGTVLAQVGAGVQSGYFTMIGAILAGIVWAGFLKPFSRPLAGITGNPKVPRYLTIHNALGLKRTTTIMIVEAICISSLCGMELFTSPGPRTNIPPPAGGLLIGLAQLFSILTRKALLGASMVYEDVGSLFWRAMPGFEGREKPQLWNSIIFTVGTISGACTLSFVFSPFENLPSLFIPFEHAMIGGFLIVLGSRIAGGCTSGHGISGMSLLSISSVITIGTAMMAGFLTRHFVRDEF